MHSKVNHQLKARLITKTSNTTEEQMNTDRVGNNGVAYYKPGTELPEGSVYVFISKFSGRHGYGTSRLAIHKYGALFNKSTGFHGQSYALCFECEDGVLLSEEIMIKRFKLFERFANDSYCTYYVADFINEIDTDLIIKVAPILRKIRNCYFPISFKQYINLN